jgi:diaminohydroxyphosphoribosylaminopyrimidine deaminase/5-amino-6-(5-phosphoribosylamino)uracil reductase
MMGEWMNPSDEILMIRAIEQAEQCRPIADRIPKVGAVIAVGDTVIGMGHRGTGQPGDDDHAEMVALRGVADRAELAKATVYTTLEPCTPEVRSDPLTCCTELIRQAEVKKVFIGILDPNQGVRGKGLWELQERGIEVELFPPHLARRIRILNDKFIREQRKLGIRITNLESGQTIRTDDKDGVFELEGTFLNEPGKDVFAFLGKDTRWWPQPYSLSVSEGNRWSVKFHFGTYGVHTLAIVRSNELGLAFIEFYRKVVWSNRDRRKLVTEHVRHVAPEELHGIVHILGFDYPSIDMTRLPKGFELQAQVEINVMNPPGPSK